MNTKICIAGLNRRAGYATVDKGKGLFVLLTMVGSSKLIVVRYCSKLQF